MSTVHSLPPTLPAEILIMILGAADNVFLYTVCRQVSRFFRAEVDKLVRTRKIQETIIIWPTSHNPNGHGCQFEQLSEDGNRAFFRSRRIHNPSHRLRQISPSCANAIDEASLPSDGISNFFDRVCKFEKALEIDWPWQTGPITRIGLDVNNICTSDVPLPDLLTYPSGLVSVKWKKLFVSIFREKSMITAKSTECSIMVPSACRIPAFGDNGIPVMTSLDVDYIQLGHISKPSGPAGYESRLDIYHKHHPYPPHTGTESAVMLRFGDAATAENLKNVEIYAASLRLLQSFEEHDMHEVTDLLGQRWWIARRGKAQETNIRQ